MCNQRTSIQVQLLNTFMLHYFIHIYFCSLLVVCYCDQCMHYNPLPPTWLSDVSVCSDAVFSKRSDERRDRRTARIVPTFRMQQLKWLFTILQNMREIDALCETPFDAILFDNISQITNILFERKPNPQCYQIHSIIFYYDIFERANSY